VGPILAGLVMMLAFDATTSQIFWMDGAR